MLPACVLDLTLALRSDHKAWKPAEGGNEWACKDSNVRMLHGTSTEPVVNVTCSLRYRTLPCVALVVLTSIFIGAATEERTSWTRHTTVALIRASTLVTMTAASYQNLVQT